MSQFGVSLAVVATEETKERRTGRNGVESTSTELTSNETKTEVVS